MVLNNVVEYDYDYKQIFYWEFELTFYINRSSGFDRLEANNYYMDCCDYGMGAGLPLWF